MRGFAVCLAPIAALSASQVARAAKSDDAFVWFTTHVCNTKLEPGAEGSSPERPMEGQDFSEIYDRAAQ